MDIISEETPCVEKVNETENEKKEEKLGFWESITLEPMWFGIVIPIMCNVATLKNFYLRNICKTELGYPEELCLNPPIELKRNIEIQSQKIYADLSYKSSLVCGVISNIVILFAAPWSDTSGRRKPVILMPIIFMMITSTMMGVACNIPHLSTMLLVYLHNVPSSFGGDYGLLFTSAFNYLGDICYKTGRCATTVMGSNNGMALLCTAIGILIFAMFDKMFTMTEIYIGIFCLQLSSLIYAIFMIKDVNASKEKTTIFDLTSSINAFRTVFKKREGSKRKNLLLMMTVPCVNTIVQINEFGMCYLYVRSKFQWDQLEYYYLVLFKMLLQVLGTFLMVNIFNKKLKMSNKQLGILGALSLFVSAFIFLITQNVWMLLASSIAGIFMKGVIIAERPILNEQISANEQGKVSCVSAILERSVSLAASPIMNKVYGLTVSTMPSAVIFGNILAAIVQFICYILVEKPESESKKIDQSDEEKQCIEKK